MKKGKFKKLNAVLAVIILECVAILGALPFIPHWRSVSPYPVGLYYISLWEDSIIAFAAFLAIVLGGIIWYTRHESIRVQIVAVMIIVGLLLLTIELVQTLT